MAIYVKTLQDSYIIEHGYICGAASEYIQAIKGGVVRIHATQPELDMIRSQFSGLPSNSGLCCHYFGDHASFIIANLNFKSGEND